MWGLLSLWLIGCYFVGCLRYALQLSRHHQNFCKKELILNQRYLPHPDSDSTDFFFEIEYFFTKNPDLQLYFADLAPRRPDLRRKFTALKNCLQPHWFLDQRYLLHPDSDSTDFFLNLGIFSQGIKICNYILQIFHQNIQIWPATRRPRNPAKMKKKKISTVCPRKCSNTNCCSSDTNCCRSNPEIL